MKIIHGGGFTGLSLAYSFHQKNIPFQLFEKSSYLGGLIQAKKTPYGWIQLGPQSLLLKKNHPFIPHLKKQMFSSKFFLTPEGLKNKHSLVIPFLKNFFFPLKKKSTLQESLQESFSQDVIHDFLNPILKGIFATSSLNLSQEFIFPYKTFFQFLRQFRSLSSYSHQKSLYHFLSELSEPFQKSLHLKESFEGSLHQDEHYFCLPAYETAKYLPDLKEDLERISYLDSHQVHVFFLKTPSLLAKGFGWLISERFSLKVQGILKKDHHFIFFYGQNFQEQDFFEDLKYFSRTQEDLLFYLHTPYLKAFPSYNKEHYASFLNLQKKTKKNIYLLGSYLSFPGLRSLYTQVEKIPL